MQNSEVILFGSIINLKIETNTSKLHAFINNYNILNKLEKKKSKISQEIYFIKEI